ncbi:MAG: hypothetical protein HFI33_00695 [Lachnospiraceae bacterium]|nr:hypothetical protein [Lachnospiraceae bacterium]
MKKRKTNILWMVLDLIFLIVFNVLFFSMAGWADHPASVWISYGFIHGSYVLFILTPILVAGGKGHETAQGYSLYTIGTAYFMIELVAGVIFILLHPADWKAALIIQILLLAVYAFALLSHTLSDEKAAAREQRLWQEQQFTRAAVTRLEAMQEGLPDKELKKLLERASQTVKNGSRESNPRAQVLESGMLYQIGAIQRAMFSQEEGSAEKETSIFLRMAQERDRLLRQND